MDKWQDITLFKIFMQKQPLHLPMWGNLKRKSYISTIISYAYIFKICFWGVKKLSDKQQEIWSDTQWWSSHDTKDIAGQLTNYCRARHVKCDLLIALIDQDDQAKYIMCVIEIRNILGIYSTWLMAVFWCLYLHMIAGSKLFFNLWVLYRMQSKGICWTKINS